MTYQHTGPSVTQMTAAERARIHEHIPANPAVLRYTFIFDASMAQVRTALWEVGMHRDRYPVAPWAPISCLDWEKDDRGGEHMWLRGVRGYAQPDIVMRVGWVRDGQGRARGTLQLEGRFDEPDSPESRHWLGKAMTPQRVHAWARALDNAIEGPRVGARQSAPDAGGRAVA